MSNRQPRLCHHNHHNPCCARPAPVSYVFLAHLRGENVSEMDSEVWWYFECWSCGLICTCEV